MQGVESGLMETVPTVFRSSMTLVQRAILTFHLSWGCILPLHPLRKVLWPSMVTWLWSTLSAMNIIPVPNVYQNKTSRSESDAAPTALLKFYTQS